MYSLEYKNGVRVTYPNLYREWEIWSSFFGKVIAVNGVSSSGKSTLSKFLTKCNWNVVSMDTTRDELLLRYAKIHFTESMVQLEMFAHETDVLKVLCGFKFTLKNYSMGEIKFIKSFQCNFYEFLLHDSCFITTMDILDAMYQESKKFIFSGNNVVLDIMAYGDVVEMLHYSFMHYPIKVGLLYASLSQTLLQCLQRNYISFKHELLEYRHPVDVMMQYSEFYKFVVRDCPINYHPFEKINKDEIRNILDIAQYSQRKLLDCFKHHLISEDAQCFIDEDNKFALMRGLIHTFTEQMKLHTDEEVFVIANVKYDFVIKLSDLHKLYNNDLYSIHGLSSEVIDKSINEAYLGTFSTHTQKASAMIASVVSHKIDNHANVRFIVYQDNHLPHIIGCTGPIIEIEHNHGLIKLLGSDSLMESE